MHCDPNADRAHSTPIQDKLPPGIRENLCRVRYVVLRKASKGSLTVEPSSFVRQRSSLGLVW